MKFREFFLNESIKLDKKQIKSLMKKFKPSSKNITIFRRPNLGYTSIGVALNKDVYLKFYGNEFNIVLLFSQNKYEVDWNDDYFGFYNASKENDFKKMYVDKRFPFYQEARNFFHDLEDKYISGPKYENNKLTNGYEQASKYPNLTF